jgi:glycosyltransferase involved in cell wall biosynthesis
MFVAPVARLAGVRLTITSRRWSDELLPTRIHLLANRLAYRISHVVLANSDILAASLVRHRAVGAQKVVVVENFIDDEGFRLLPRTARASARAALGIPPEGIVAVAVARFRPEKDLLTLLRASGRVAAIRPDFHVLLVGSGPCEEQLRSAAAELAISDRVHFAGLMVGPPSAHQLGEFSVLCSLHEGFPNSIIEAMAVGNPVVATAVGGVPEAVEDNHTGILVPPGAVDELARAMAQLSSDACLRRRLGDNGRERVKARYSSTAVLSKLARLYEASAPRGRTAIPSVHYY